LGLVAGVFDRLGIGEVIDSHLPKSRHHKVPHSDATKAMIMVSMLAGLFLCQMGDPKRTQANGSVPPGSEGKESHREIANLTDSLMIVIRILGKEEE